jgi:hypothetical protein
VLLREAERFEYEKVRISMIAAIATQQIRQWMIVV